jgi:hypothetical protein
MTPPTASSLPPGFADLEPFVTAWALPTRQERYDKRLSSSLDELVSFYDAVAPHAEAAIEHLNACALDAMPDADLRLLRLLYSLVLVSYAVNVFDQPKIPDSGAAFFDCVVEPAV